jgi:hypothetical protein
VDEQPWDFAFGQHEPFWVVVHLRDLRRIGGRFAGNSFALSSPSEPQIYLEEVWKVDERGRLVEPVERSRGVVIIAKPPAGGSGVPATPPTQSAPKKD